MYALRRTQAAGFTLDQAVTLEAVQASADPASRGCCCRWRPTLPTTPPPDPSQCPGREKRSATATPPPLPGEDGVYRVYSPEGAFLALSRLDQGRLTTIKKLFFEV